MIDAHCHIIPGVDDGSRTIRSSIRMLEAARSCGITHMVATSHLKDGFADIATQTEQFNLIVPHAAQMGITLIQGSEVHWREAQEMNSQYSGFKLGNSSMFLLEFSLGPLTESWQQIIFDIQCQGLTVIVAHPERYKTVQQDEDTAQQMKDMGCLLMSSANFLDKTFLGGRGKIIKNTTKNLLKAGLIDMICSDAHTVEGYSWLPEALKFASKCGFDESRAQGLLSTIFS